MTSSRLYPIDPAVLQQQCFVSTAIRSIVAHYWQKLCIEKANCW